MSSKKAHDDSARVFKKYADFLNLFLMAVSTTYTIISFVFSYLQAIIFPTLVGIIIFYIIMKFLIIREEYIIKAFKLRMIFWFGMVFIVITPPFFYLIMEAMIWIRGPILLPDYPVPSGGIFGPIGILLLIPIFGVPFFSMWIIKKVGNGICFRLEKDQKRLTMKIRETLLLFSLYPRDLFNENSLLKREYKILIFCLTIIYGSITASYYNFFFSEEGIQGFFNFVPMLLLNSSMMSWILSITYIVCHADDSKWSLRKAVPVFFLVVIIGGTLLYLILFHLVLPFYSDL